MIWCTKSPGFYYRLRGEAYDLVHKSPGFYYLPPNPLLLNEKKQ